MTETKANSYTRLTLALDILGRVKGGPLAGYHDLGIVKQLVSLSDEITITSSEDLLITCTEDDVPTDESNTCARAVRALQRSCDVTDNVHIHITKNTPREGGLAAGSSNAATVMSLLNERWNLKLSQAKLVEISREVGMDVGFFFYGGTAYDKEVSGLPISIDTNVQLHFLLIFPVFGISTVKAFQGIDHEKVGQNTERTGAMREGFSQGKVQVISQSMHNDFEGSAFMKYPELVQIKNDLQNVGAMSAGMTGSGSTMMGLFTSEEAALDAKKKLQQHNSVTCNSLGCT